MGFKAETRRAFVGPKHELECLKKEDSSGKIYSIWPKKLPQWASDKINALQTRVLVNPGAVTRVKALAKAREDGRELTDEETAGAATIMQEMPEGINAEIARLCVENGIGQHDFDDDDGKIIGEGLRVTPELVSVIMDFWPLAQEIAKVVSEYSRPLLQKSKES